MLVEYSRGILQRDCIVGYSSPLQCALFWQIWFIYFSLGRVALQTYWHSKWCWFIQEAKRWSHLLCFFICLLFFPLSLSLSFSQEDYNRLLTKYAEAENTIDRLRLEAKVGFTDCVYDFMLCFPSSEDWREFSAIRSLVSAGLSPFCVCSDVGESYF